MKDQRDDLERWREDWQQVDRAARVDLALLRRRHRRRTFGLGVLLAVDILVALAGYALLAWAAGRSGELLDVAMAAIFALLISWILILEVRSLRGLWQPSAETATAFLDLSIARCRRWIHVVRWGWRLLLVEVILFVPWIALRFLSRPPSRPATLGQLLGSLGVLGATAGVIALALLLLHAWAKRRLASLHALRASLEE